MKEEFKTFVKNNPKLIKYVNNNEMTWQKFYEMYSLYGEDNNVWNTYLNPKDTRSITGFKDVVNWFKDVDLNSFKESINNVERVIGLLQDFNVNNKVDIKDTYKPRPLYKHFED